MEKAGECRPFSWDSPGERPRPPRLWGAPGPGPAPGGGGPARAPPPRTQPLAYSERLMVKLPNTGASRWPLNSRVLW